MNLVLAVCVILPFLTVCSGVNIFPTFDVYEHREISACIAYSGSKRAVDAYKECKAPDFVLAMIGYCIKLAAPDAANLYEAYKLAKKNLCLIDEVYYCLLENIHCITCYDKYLKMAEFETCNRAVRDSFCPIGVHPKPKCNDPKVKPVPRSNSTCCIGDCVFKGKTNSYGTNTCS